MPATVLSTLALKGTLEKLRADFDRAIPGLQIRFDATQAILAGLREGAKADVLILTAEAMETLQKEGRVREARKLGSSGVGVAVRAGASQPDVSTLEAFKNTLLNAQSVAHSKVGASGLYFSSILKDLGFENRLKKRVVVEKGPVGLVVARGEAEIGIQQLCELAPVPGIDIVGGLPAPLQVLTWFSAGIVADTKDLNAAQAFLNLLTAETTKTAMRESRIDPAPLMREDVIKVGQLEIRYLIDGTSHAGMGVFELTVPPGSNVPPPHSHTNNEECVYVLEGTLRYSVDGETRDLRAGDWMRTPKGSVHGFSNPHDARARALIVLSPDIGAEYFRDVASVAKAGGPPDRAQLLAVMGRYGLVPAPQR